MDLLTSYIISSFLKKEKFKIHFTHEQTKTNQQTFLYFLSKAKEKAPHSQTNERPNIQPTLHYFFLQRKTQRKSPHSKQTDRHFITFSKENFKKSHLSFTNKLTDRFSTTFSSKIKKPPYIFG